MKDDLKILHLEDDPLDTELVMELLTSAGLRIEMERVDSLPSFRQRLESPAELDLILSDFSVPGMDIYASLQEARRLRPLTPIIIVSGTLGEEKAVEMLHLGASDYVLKQGMERLVPAIRRALREAQEQTRRLAAEEALIAAKEAAEAGTRAKDRFLLTMSHELRTPLTVIMGMQELALAEDLAPTVRTYLEAAHKSSETLLSLITDILDFSGIEEGRILLEENPLDFHQLLQEIVASFLPAAREKNLSLTISLPPCLPRTVIGDARRLTQILRNLIGNAVRFTQAGRIDIEAGCGPEQEKETREFSVTVRDTGVGIPDEALDHIFDRFNQADMSLTRRYGGAGLGLAISRGLVERMGGKIAAQSKVGDGSVFSFVIPLRVPAGSTRSAQNAPPRILIVEDEPMIGDLLQMILAKEGWTAEAVGDGRTALEILEKESFSLILMDVQMPVMDGLETTRAIRLREGEGQRIPIIAVTAHAREEDREICRQSGMDAVVVKPLQVPQLLETIKKYLG